MKKIVICTFIVFAGLSLSTINQSFGKTPFSHALGGSYYIGGGAGAPGITYSPRYNFLEIKKELTMSIGTHIGLGFSFNSQDGASSFALDLPIMLEINFGHASDAHTRTSFGGFGGIGFGISKIGSSGTFGADYNNAAGLVFNAGIRAIIKERPVGLRISYMVNTKIDAEDVIGIGIFYTLSM